MQKLSGKNTDTIFYQHQIVAYLRYKLTEATEASYLFGFCDKATDSASGKDQLLKCPFDEARSEPPPKNGSNSHTTKLKLSSQAVSAVEGMSRNGSLTFSALFMLTRSTCMNSDLCAHAHFLTLPIPSCPFVLLRFLGVWSVLLFPFRFFFLPFFRIFARFCTFSLLLVCVCVYTSEIAVREACYY